MSNAISSQGTKFYYWVADSSSAGGTWTLLSEVTGIDGPSRSRETIDVTSLDSTDGYREFIGSFRDGGTVSLSMNFTAATFAIMNTHFDSDDNQQYKVVLPDTAYTGFEFEGIVTDSPISVEVGSQVKADVTIKVSGKTTLTTGAVT